MFKIDAFFNPHLPQGQSRLDSVLTIQSDGQLVQYANGRKVIAFVMDVSGSMNGDKLKEAKLAARKGIEMLSEDVWFFVVIFSSDAHVLVECCQATLDNKEIAHQRIQSLTDHGSTAISKGLELALREVKAAQADVASIYFLTDGQNDREDNPRLPGVIEQCKGYFQCDCRGIGTDWEPKELKRIASALLGTADAVTDPAKLDADLRNFLAKSLQKGISGTVLRLWTPKVVKVVTAQQVSPEIQDLLPLTTRIDEKTIDIPLGAWGNEARDYQLAFELPMNNVGEEMLACRATLVYQGNDGEVKVACDPIAVKWSDDANLTARMSKEVAHYTGQAELANSIQEGLEAKAHGDNDKATRLLGRAAKLAADSGNEEVTKRLKKVVDIVDAGAGTVRLRKTDKAADMELEMGGTRTVRRRSGQV